MKKFLLATTAAIAFIAPAQAADLPVKAPPQVVVTEYNWTGLYIGAHCGWATTRTRTSNDPPFGGFDEGAPLSFDNNASGPICGGQWGYNWQNGRVVFGLEGEFSWVGINRERRDIGPAAEDLVAVRYSWVSTWTGRLGIAYDRALFYAKGGAAWARIRNTASDLIVTGGAVDAGDFSEVTRTRWGWAVGGGIEYGVAPNWSLKAEYLYHNFGSYQSPLNADGDTFTHRNELHTVKFGINYRWGAPVIARY